MVFQTNGTLCEFLDDGKILVSQQFDQKLMLLDANDTVLWQSNDYVHHDLKLMNMQTEFLAITSEIIDYKNTKVRSDCFSRRNLQNKILHEWCLSKNIKKMEELGFDLTPRIRKNSSYTLKISIDKEISHANSIYEIPKNALEKTHEAFKAGNYLLHIFMPSMALIIVDREMKNILWTKNLGQLEINNQKMTLITHDNQVLEDGYILSYLNLMLEYHPHVKPNITNEMGSKIIKWHPLNNDIQVLYAPSNSQDFKSLVLGTVEQVRSDQFLFTDITNESKVSIIQPNKGVIWEMIVPSPALKDTKFVIRRSKILKSDSFLKARKILN